MGPTPPPLAIALIYSYISRTVDLPAAVVSLRKPPAVVSTAPPQSGGAGTAPTQNDLFALSLPSSANLKEFAAHSIGPFG